MSPAANAASQRLALVRPEPHSSVLRAEGLMKRYRKRTVVSDVSLAVESGEVVGLLGPNGAGKTTCFYMILGLVPIDGGVVTLDGEDLTHLPIFRRSRLGLSYLPQEASIFRKLTVAQNIQAVLELQGLEDEEVDARLRAAAGRPAHRAPAREPRAFALGRGDGGAWRSPARWPRARASSCSTSPSPASIPSRCSTSSRSSASSRSVASACSSPITTCARRSASATTPTSSIEGTVLAFGKPQDIVYNEAVRKVYLGENFRL